MKKRFLWSVIVTTVLIFSTVVTARLEVEEGALPTPTSTIPEVKVLTYGQKESFKVSQKSVYPLDMGNALIICLGTGTLKMTCKSALAGRMFFMGGFWLDDSGKVKDPFIQFGYGDMSIIGKFKFTNEDVPLSYVFITSAALLATDAKDVLPYEYSIELEFVA